MWPWLRRIFLRHDTKEMIWGGKKLYRKELMKQDWDCYPWKTYLKGWPFLSVWKLGLQEDSHHAQLIRLAHWAQTVRTNNMAYAEHMLSFKLLHQNWKLLLFQRYSSQRLRKKYLQSLYLVKILLSRTYEEL